MRIAIVDDSTQDLAELLALLTDYFKALSVCAEFCTYQTTSAFLQEFTPQAFSIIFLDIYLGTENGMDAARTVRQSDTDCRLVFFTSSFDHAVDSYRVHASYYLTKPIEPEQLHDALQVCCEGLLEDARVLRITMHQTAGTIPLQKIYYIDCVSRTVRIHLAAETLTVSDSLSAISAQLSENVGFLACNRGVWVNLAHVSQTSENDFILKNGSCVPLRVRGKGALKKAYLAYSLRSLQRRARP